MYLDIIYLIPLLVLMKFLDSYLTVWAYRNYRHYARKTVMLENYEANPRWQKDVEHGFKDWRHFTFLLLIISVLSLLYYFEPTRLYYAFFSGFAFFLYLSINFEHLAHIRELEQIPGKVRGKVFYTLDYYFSTVTHNYVKFSAILFFAWILTQHLFLFGGIFGPLLIATLIKVRWEVYSSEKK